MESPCRSIATLEWQNIAMRSDPDRIHADRRWAETSPHEYPDAIHDLAAIFSISCSVPKSPRMNRVPG